MCQTIQLLYVSSFNIAYFFKYNLRHPVFCNKRWKIFTAGVMALIYDDHHMPFHKNLVLHHFTLNNSAYMTLNAKYIYGKGEATQKEGLVWLSFYYNHVVRITKIVCTIFLRYAIP